MAERSSQENFMLDMLGDELRDAVIEARDRLEDETIVVRIGGHDMSNPTPGLVHVERGDPAEVLESAMTVEEAMAFLEGLE
jgi:hypothetical protein